mgnify:FL=1
MKKIMLFLLLVSSTYAESPKTYLGASFGYLNENFTNADAQASMNSMKFKAGYGERKAYAVEFSLDYAQSKAKIFSSSNNVSSDGDRYGLNIDLVKGFDFDVYVLPFVKAGFGAGRMRVDRELQDKLSYGAFSVGAGFLIPINEHFDLEVVCDYKKTSYEKINLISSQIRYESNLNVLYFGFNTRF